MRRRYRSFFWPAVLIGIGLIWLLTDARVISIDRLYLLFDLWPVILIVIGLELIARRVFQGQAGEVAAVLIVVMAAVGALAYVALAPATDGGTQTLDSSGSVGTVNAASVRIDAGATTFTVAGSSNLGGDLYRAHIRYSGHKPDVSFDRSTATLTISQSGDEFILFQNRRLVLTLELNPAVPWAITVNTAAASATYDLRNIRVESMELNTATSRDDITVGRPSGIVPITVNGAALTVNLHRPAGTAASANVSGAALNLNVDGRQIHALGGANWESANFQGATDGYSLTVNGAACNVTTDTTGPNG